MSSAKFNMKNPAIKRILQEVKEMQSNPSDDYLSLPLEDNIFEWQFAIRGPQDTEFEGGIYHGRIQLPSEYPFKPPAFMLLTPNGRFETQTKICLSISQYHPEHWQPSWSVRTALVALIAFMPTKANGAIGSLEFSKEERKALALKSIEASPKYGTAERQKLIDEIHEQMIKRVNPAQASHPMSCTPAMDVGTELSSSPSIDRNEEEMNLKDAKNLSQEFSREGGNSVNEFVLPGERVDVVAPPAAYQDMVEPPIIRPNTRQQASDDRGLTLLAVGLVVALAALLMRKIFHSHWWIKF